MQIFRPYKSHKKSAMFLDDARLNKQVLESFQINNFIFRVLGLLDDGRKPGNYANHPVVRFVYNDGRPYLPDHYNYMIACNNEWKRRGRLRSSEFDLKMIKQKELILNHSHMFSWEPLPPYLRFGDIEITGPDTYRQFQALLFAKWKYDKIVVKSSIKI